MAVAQKLLVEKYIQSEVGLIPADWLVTDLSALAVLVTGNTPPTSDSRNYGDKYLFVSPADLGSHKWIKTSEKKISEHGKAFSRLIPQKAVLFVCIGSTIGKTGLAAVELCTNQQITSAIAKDIDTAEFLYYALDFIAPRISFFAGQQAVPIVNKTEFGKSRIAVPASKTEQKAISTVLSDTDALISALERLIEKKRNIKQGVMQALLTGKRRLPGFSGEWKLVALGDIAKLYQPQTIAAKDFVVSGYPVYGANGVVGYYGKYNHENWQIAITCRGSTCGIVNKTAARAWITGNAMVVNCDDNQQIDKLFLYYKLAASDLSKCITGSGQPQIVRAPLASFQLTIPSTPGEQSKIAELLAALDDEVQVLQQRLTKAQSLKQALMQTLLTGKIRLTS